MNRYDCGLAMSRTLCHLVVATLLLWAPGSNVGRCAAATGPSAGPVRVIVRPAACLRAEMVRLGDIAELEGPAGKVSALQTLVLGRAPLAGQVVVWSRRDVLDRLRRHGVSREQVKLDGAERVYITLDVVRLRSEQVLEAVRRWMQRQLPELVSLGFEPSVALAAPIYVPTHYGAVRLEPVLRTPTVPAAALVRVDVRVVAGRRVVATVPVYLRRSSNRATDVKPAAFGRASLDGRPLVKRRDVVRIVARSRFLRVSATGEALQDGRRGQFIRVRNLRSGRVIVARVVDAGMVEVLF